jgi:hypothetical protein
MDRVHWCRPTRGAPHLHHGIAVGPRSHQHFIEQLVPFCPTNLPPTMPDSPQWSQHFALLQPLNIDSHNMLRDRRNRSHRVPAAHFNIAQVDRLSGKKCLLSRLDFAMIMGRRCIDFGSSRANDIAFPKAPGVEPYHFSIHFEPSTGAILLSDRSKAGTRVQFGEGRPTLLRSATCVLSSGAQLIVGKGQRFRFELKLTVPETEPETFQRLLRAYLGTLEDLKGEAHTGRLGRSRPEEHAAAGGALAVGGTHTRDREGGVDAGGRPQKPGGC